MKKVVKTLMVSREKKIVFLLALCTILVCPALAGTKYMVGSPDLSAYISGTNEFSPGDDVTLTIVIQNTGLNEYKFVQSGIVDDDEQPNTAKFLTATLSSGEAPLVIKSEPRMLGDLKGASSVSAVFAAKINKDAPAGTYALPLSLNYTSFYSSDQYGVDTIGYSYKTQVVNLTVPLKIGSDMAIDVVSVTPEHVNVGTEGYLNLKIKNTGSESGSKAIVKISRNGNSPIVPMDNSVFIGEFPSGGIVDCRYKVSVSKNVERQTYPVDVSVVYQNREGDTITSRTDTIGVPVGSKVSFEITSPAPEMNPGSKNTLMIVYKNTGDSPVYSALARISAVDPFTSNDDIAYLGDLQPGQSGTAEFVLSVDRAATIKEYGLDSEIRYRDALDNTYISDIMKVRVNVASLSGIAAIVSNPIYLSIILAVIIGIVYSYFHSRKKQ